MQPTGEIEEASNVDLRAIREAARRIQTSIYETPFVYPESVSE